MRTEFKSYSDDDKLRHLSTVIKAFQDEFNKLTARAKFAEVLSRDLRRDRHISIYINQGALVGLYKTMCDAPDPAPLLEEALVSRNADTVWFT